MEAALGDCNVVRVGRFRVPVHQIETLTDPQFREWLTISLANLSNRLGLEGFKVIEIRYSDANPGDAKHAYYYDLMGYQDRRMMPVPRRWFSLGSDKIAQA